MKRMLFNATHAEELRVCTVDGQKLIDMDIESSSRQQRKSNIYKGIVTRIEPALEACFVDYGEERHGFLPFKEISRAYFKPNVDFRNATIKDAIAEGDEFIVQVEKEERGNKGAALTTFISLAGRYLVLMPNNPRGGGVSRRVEGEERQELKEAMARLSVPKGMSLIARTAGIGRSTEELQWDLDYLIKLWDAVKNAAAPQYEDSRGDYVSTPTGADGEELRRINPAPFLILEESNLVIRAIRDYFQPEIGEILIDTDDIFEQARQFMGHVMPDMVSRVKRYTDDVPLFSRFQIENQIETVYSRTVPLPSGGAIVIDHTEALVAIDVNSARSTKGADIEETAFKTNIEAADEVARQIRLRDLGGLIVIDFIDMEDSKNQEAVEQRMKEAIYQDRARVQFVKLSRFGLMELSRQRLRPALYEGSHIACPRCNGVGVIRDTVSSAIQVLRILQEEALKEGTAGLQAQVPVDVATYLLNEKREEIAGIEHRHNINVFLIPNKNLETPHYQIERLRGDDERLETATAPTYARAEEIQPEDKEPYSRSQAPQQSDRPKQVPVIKGLPQREDAPKHVEKKKTPKPDKKKASPSLWDRLVGFFKSDSKPAPKPKKKSKKDQPRKNSKANQAKKAQGSKKRERGEAGEAKIDRRFADKKNQVKEPAPKQSFVEERSDRPKRKTRKVESAAPENVVTTPPVAPQVEELVQDTKPAVQVQPEVQEPIVPPAPVFEEKPVEPQAEAPKKQPEPTPVLHEEPELIPTITAAPPLPVDPVVEAIGKAVGQTSENFMSYGDTAFSGGLSGEAASAPKPNRTEKQFRHNPYRTRKSHSERRSRQPKETSSEPMMFDETPQQAPAEILDIGDLFEETPKAEEKPAVEKAPVVESIPPRPKREVADEPLLEQVSTKAFPEAVPAEEAPKPKLGRKRVKKAVEEEAPLLEQVHTKPNEE